MVTPHGVILGWVGLIVRLSLRQPRPWMLDAHCPDGPTAHADCVDFPSAWCGDAVEDAAVVTAQHAGVGLLGSSEVRHGYAVGDLTALKDPDHVTAARIGDPDAACLV